MRKFAEEVCEEVGVFDIAFTARSWQAVLNALKPKEAVTVLLRLP